MSYGCVVNATMEIRNKDLIDRINSCIFKNPDYICVETVDKYTRVSSEMLMDVAKFIGLRDELVGRKKLDQNKFNKVAALLEMEKPSEFISCSLCMNLYEKYGYAILTLEGLNGYPGWLFKYISRITPGEEYVVEEDWFDYDYHNSYKLQNGVEIEENKKVNLKRQNKNLEPLYSEAMQYAYGDKYEEAIEKLLPLAKKRYGDSCNNLGVCYERIGKYEEARKWYEKCGKDLALENLLNLYFHKLIRFNKKKYISICNDLMKKHDPRGYHEMFGYYAYSGLVKQDYEMAFDYLIEGIINCKVSTLLIFDLAYAFEKGIGVQVDNVKSHKYYGVIVDGNGEKVAKYNYAFQCYQGRGCEKDVRKAIKYFEESAGQGYKDAIRYLIQIYNSEEYKDEAKYKYYKSQL